MIEAQYQKELNQQRRRIEQEVNEQFNQRLGEQSLNQAQSVRNNHDFTKFQSDQEKKKAALNTEKANAANKEAIENQRKAEIVRRFKEMSEAVELALFEEKGKREELLKMFKVQDQMRKDLPREFNKERGALEHASQQIQAKFDKASDKSEQIRQKMRDAIKQNKNPDRGLDEGY